MAAAETRTVVHASGQPIKILLQKNMGGYNWEVHVSGTSIAEIMPIIREADNKLKSVFGGSLKR